MSETTSGRLSNKEENGAQRQSSDWQMSEWKKVRVKEASRLIIKSQCLKTKRVLDEVADSLPGGWLRPISKIFNHPLAARSHRLRLRLLCLRSGKNP